MTSTFSHASTASKDPTMHYHIFLLNKASLVKMNTNNSNVFEKLDNTFNKEDNMLRNVSHDLTFDDVLMTMERAHCRSGISVVLLCLRLPGESSVSFEMYVRVGRQKWKYYPTVFSRKHNNTLDTEVMQNGEFKEVLHNMK